MGVLTVSLVLAFGAALIPVFVNTSRRPGRVARGMTQQDKVAFALITGDLIWLAF
jgi:hypothetical protein